MFDFPITKIDKHALACWTVAFLNILFDVIEFFTDLIFGWTYRLGSKKDRDEAKADGRTVHLVQIVMRGAYGDTYKHHPRNFFCRHIKYVSPQWLVENDKATLMGVTEKEFFFCVTTNPQSNVVDTSISPFMFALQFLMSEQLAIISQAEGYKLADKLGDPSAKINFLDMTGRCGSTLVATMITRVPECRVFSEPWVFLHAHSQFVNKKITRDQYKRLLHTIIRLLCRDEQETKISNILIKLTIFLNAQIEILHEINPEYNFMFITRHYKPCVKSWMKLTGTLPSFFVAKKSLMADFFFEHFPAPYGDTKWEKIRNEWRYGRVDHKRMMSVFTLNFIAQLVSYMKFKHLYSHVMIYEDMMAHPEEETEKLFDSMELDKKHMAKAKEAFNFDSQRGKFGGRGTSHIEVTPQIWKEVNDLFQEYDMPVSTEMSFADYQKLIYK